jgi:nucleoside-diphosphate-sugar epimerase
MLVEIIGGNGMLGNAILHEINEKKNNKFFLEKKSLIWSAGTLQKYLSKFEVENELNKFRIIIQDYSSKDFNKLIYLSSAGSLYKSGKTTISIESSEIKPENSYGALKLAEEEILQTEFAKYFDKIMVIRLANVYGRSFSDLSKLGLIDRAIYCAINDLELKINVDKLSRKNYGFKKDYAKNIVAIMENSNSFNPLEVFNLGPSFNYSIEEIISIISDYFHQELKVSYHNQNINETVLIETENDYLLSMTKELDPWIRLEDYLFGYTP